MLAQQGFTVEQGICGIETAFSASYGSGKPVIGILAEYDALSGLSQKGGCTEKAPLIPGGTGHGCGHNMLGAGALGAALGVKHYLQQTGCSGTVVLYGCPGEEGGAAKAFMARDELWRGLDAALTWPTTAMKPPREPATPVFRCSICSTVLPPTPPVHRRKGAARWTR